MELKGVFRIKQKGSLKVVCGALSVFCFWHCVTMSLFLTCFSIPVL